MPHLLLGGVEIGARRAPLVVDDRVHCNGMVNTVCSGLSFQRALWLSLVLPWKTRGHIANLERTDLQADAGYGAAQMVLSLCWKICPHGGVIQLRRSLRGNPRR